MAKNRVNASIKDNLYYRFPDYSLGRFFISPILGCEARCIFCYIYSHNYTVKYRQNMINIDEVIKWLLDHPHYKPGRRGSILSIGAWGDPFPRNYPTNFVLDWLTKLCSLENPVQIISRYELKQDTVEKIANTIIYKNQLLFSTSISTFRYWRQTDNFADPPELRLQTLTSFHRLGIPTNVMVKPFIPGITDTEIEVFISEFASHSVTICVVGVFYWNDQIIKLMLRQGLLTNALIDDMETKKLYHNLVCDPSVNYFTYRGDVFDDFCEQLRVGGVSVFKNSACVNAWLLCVPHVSKLSVNDPLGLCVKCGVCE